MAGRVLGLSGITVPVIDTDDDQEALLALAEAAIRAEYGALDRPVPAITRLVRAGAPAAILAHPLHRTDPSSTCLLRRTTA